MPRGRAALLDQGTQLWDQHHDFSLKRQCRAAVPHCWLYRWNSLGRAITLLTSCSLRRKVILQSQGGPLYEHTVKYKNKTDVQCCSYKRNEGKPFFNDSSGTQDLSRRTSETVLKIPTGMQGLGRTTPLSCSPSWNVRTLNAVTCLNFEHVLQEEERVLSIHTICAYAKSCRTHLRWLALQLTFIRCGNSPNICHFNPGDGESCQQLFWAQGYVDQKRFEETSEVSQAIRSMSTYFEVATSVHILLRMKMRCILQVPRRIQVSLLVKGYSRDPIERPGNVKHDKS